MPESGAASSFAGKHARLLTPDSLLFLLPPGADDDLARLMRHLARREGIPLREEPPRFRLLHLRRRPALVLHSPPAPLFSRAPLVRLWRWAVPPFVPPACRALTPEEGEALRLRYTGGAEYFLLHSAPETALRAVLSGFSAFKRRLRSGLSLLICGPVPPALEKDLGAYRYRADVHRAPLSDGPALTAGAYAVLLPAGGARNGGLGALHCGIPLITPEAGRDTFGPAPLYISGEEWGPVLLKIYTDEALWSRAAAGGPSWAEGYPLDRAAGALLQHITFAAKQSQR